MKLTTASTNFGIAKLISIHLDFRSITDWTHAILALGTPVPMAISNTNGVWTTILLVTNETLSRLLEN